MLQLELTSPSADVTAELLRELYVRLFEADERGDAVALARVGWRLLAIITEVQEAEREAAAVLNTLRSAACAAIAGQGSAASLALLRHVLAGQGWLPSPGVTPLQAVAAPRPGRK